WAQKLSSNDLRKVSSSTLPMVPCQAAPALDTTISTPPKAETTLSNAAFTLAASVTSQATANALPPIFLATALAASSSRSRMATSAPSLAMALAVAAPMPEPPPVITATWRASDFSFDLPSLACSSDQYSTSNMSNSLM